MKKLFLASALALFGVMNAQQGTFKAGVHLGLPVGNTSESFNLNYGADAAYMFNIALGLDLGITAGYTHYNGKSIKSTTLEYKNSGIGFIPVAATAQYSLPVKGLFVGADLGYAFSTEKDVKGAFYYQPKVGYTVLDKNDIYISYKGLNREGHTLNSINLGYAFKF